MLLAVACLRDRANFKNKKNTEQKSLPVISKRQMHFGIATQSYIAGEPPGRTLPSDSSSSLGGTR